MAKISVTPELIELLKKSNEKEAEIRYKLDMIQQYHDEVQQLLAENNYYSECIFFILHLDEYTNFSSISDEVETSDVSKKSALYRSDRKDAMRIRRKMEKKHKAKLFNNANAAEKNYAKRIEHNDQSTNGLIQPIVRANKLIKVAKKMSS